MSHEVVSILKEAFGRRPTCYVGGPCLGGKTTRLKIAAAALKGIGVLAFDTSTIINGEIKGGTDLGQVFSETREKHGNSALQPDKESMLAVAKAVRKACEDDLEQRKRIIIVGTPRTQTQSRWLIQADVNFSCVHFTASQRQTEENLNRRLAENRPDDNPNDFKERLQIYWQRTVPALTMLKKHRSRRFHEFETGHHNIKQAVVLLIEATIGRNHPNWREVTGFLHNSNHEAGKALRELRPNRDALIQALA